jgi:hypothetical protein
VRALVEYDGGIDLPVGTRGGGSTFEGFGAVSAGASSRLLIDYEEPARSEILDTLFRPGHGAALQHLTVEVGSDTNTTDGAEPSHMRSRDDFDCTRGYEWWLMKEARRRNPDITLEALAWGAPGWLGNGTYASQDTADYLARFVEGARDKHGLTIDYVGVWNEMRYEPPWIKLLKRTLEEHGLATRLVAADGTWEIADDMRDDPELREAIDVIGVHYPDLHGGYREHASELGVRLWASEDGAWMRVEGALSGEWAGAQQLARLINHNYLAWGLTKTLVWSPITSYYDLLAFPGSGLMRACEPWSGHYTVQPAISAAAHTTQFAAPGWRYLDHACGALPRGGSLVALSSPDGEDWCIVAETAGAVGAQTLRVPGGVPVEIRRTTATGSFTTIDGGDEDGSRTAIELPVDAIVSATTRHAVRGIRLSSGSSSPFPFPWRPSFDDQDDGASPRYFADQEGAFEVRRRAIVQVVTERPIPWTCNFLNPSAPTPTPAENFSAPWTIVGDARWRDYEVSARIALEGSGEAAVAGRVTGPAPGGWTLILPGAYWLAVDALGGWQLRVTHRRDARNSKPDDHQVVLAEGRYTPAPWVELALRFEGAKLTALVAGTIVATVSNETYATGAAGLGSGWNVARFTDFRVEAPPS